MQNGDFLKRVYELNRRVRFSREPNSKVDRQDWKIREGERWERTCECCNRENWRLFCQATPVRELPRWKQSIIAMDAQKNYSKEQWDLRVFAIYLTSLFLKLDSQFLRYCSIHLFQPHLIFFSRNYCSLTGTLYTCVGSLVSLMARLALPGGFGRASPVH